MTKKLYKSNTNKMLSGVCGGIGEYFGVDPTVIRVVWALVGWPVWGIIAYFVCASIIPSAPDGRAN
jgi:phage shock protein PspC (stress-responsive transcriptional regulator)